MPYAIKCITEGEQRLAQDILFKKGITWLMQGATTVVRPDGQWLVVRGDTITYLSVNQWGQRKRDYLKVVTMSELLHV